MAKMCMTERTADKNCSNCIHCKYDVTYGEACCYAEPNEYGAVYWAPAKNETEEYPEQIEIIWTVDDILDMLVGIDKDGNDVLYRDLGMTRQEAARVLHEAEEHFDANEGITWYTLRYWVDELYSDKYKYNEE